MFHHKILSDLNSAFRFSKLKLDRVDVEGHVWGHTVTVQHRCYIALITSNLLHSHMRCHTFFACISMNIPSALCYGGATTLKWWCCVGMPSPPSLHMRVNCALEGRRCPEFFLSGNVQNCRCWLQWCRLCVQRWKVLVTNASYQSLHIFRTCAMKGRKWSWSL